MQLGIAGEFRCVVRSADSTIKIDTGYQKNLILNNGLDFLGEKSAGKMFTTCVIGSGTSTPSPEQSAIDIHVASITGSPHDNRSSYTNDGTGLYKTYVTTKFSFTSLDGVNITELGISNANTTVAKTSLCTRALIKDSSGLPTAISVTTGEILDIYYRLWHVVSTVESSHTINVTNGLGVDVPYNIRVLPSYVGDADYIDKILGLGYSSNISASATSRVSTGDLAGINTVPSGALPSPNTATSFVDELYVKGSFKRKSSYIYGPSAANGSIRTVVIGTSHAYWQMRFGSVENDSPLLKTSTEKLTIPFEISWGRYEGAL